MNAEAARTQARHGGPPAQLACSNLEGGAAASPACENGVRLEFLRALIAILLVLPVYRLIRLGDDPRLFYWFAAATAALLAVVARCRLRQRSGWLAPSLFLAAACFQNLLLGFFIADQPPAPDALFLIELKTVLLFGGALLLSLLAVKQTGRPKLVAACGGRGGLIFMAWLLVSLVLSPAPWFSKISYLRNFLAAFAGWQLGRHSASKIADIDRTLGVALATGVLVTVFSAAEILQPDIWSTLNLDLLIAMKGPVATHTDFFGWWLRRLFTAIGAPINAGFFLGILLLFAWTLKRRTLSFFLLAQIALTFAKSAVLAALVGAFVLAREPKLLNIESLRRYAVYGTALAMLAVAAYLAYVNVSVSAIASGVDVNTAAGHVYALLTAVKGVAAHPLGRGLGVGGNWSNVGKLIGALDPTHGQSAIEFLSEGTESSIGALLYQLGLLGLVAFFSWCGARFRELLAVHRSLRIRSPQHARLAVTAMGGCLGVVVAALFTEAAFAPQVSGIAFMLAGLVAGAGTLLQREPNRSMHS